MADRVRIRQGEHPFVCPDRPARWPIVCFEPPFQKQPAGQTEVCRNLLQENRLLNLTERESCTTVCNKVSRRVRLTRRMIIAARPRQAEAGVSKRGFQNMSLLSRSPPGAGAVRPPP